MGRTPDACAWEQVEILPANNEHKSSWKCKHCKKTFGTPNITRIKNHLPKLQRIAIRILSQVSSASASERNWSTYDFIHSKKRNRLTPNRAADLVYVFTNLRLMENVTSAYFEEAEDEYSSDSDDGAA